MTKKNIETGHTDFVDCSKIVIGQVAKNYGAMCELLGEKPLAGNSKVAQLKRWGRYFSFEKQGQKYVVKEIYKTPLPRVDARKLKTGVYINFIEPQILHYLSKQRDKPVFLIKLDWCISLGIMNSRFTEYMPSQNREIADGTLAISEVDMKRFDPLKKEISEKYHLPLDYEDISIFYDLALEKSYSILNSTLRSMSRRGLIKSSKAFTICYDDGSQRVVDNPRCKLFRQILEMQGQALKLIGLERINQIYAVHQFHRYYGEFKRLIKKRNKYLEKCAPKWVRVLECTKIVCLEGETKKKPPLSETQQITMTRDEVAKCRQELNVKVVASMNTLAHKQKNRFDKQNENGKENKKLPNKANYWAMKRYNYNFMRRVVTKSNFVEAQATLIDYLIRID